MLVELRQDPISRSRDFLRPQARPKRLSLLDQPRPTARRPASAKKEFRFLTGPSHLHTRLARQAAQPDPSLGSVEVTPVLAVDLDGGNRGGGRGAKRSEE